jgi:uridine phosphorylase
MNQRRFRHGNNPGFACHPSVILLPFGRESYLAAAVERCGGEEVALDESTDRLIFDLKEAPAPTTLIYSGMGGPAAANALEMAAANGARRVVLFGACGGADPAVAVGDLLVASGAVRGEGTSRYYAPLEFPAACDPELTVRLRRQSRRVAPAGAHLGPVFTTDASYRQGREIYAAFQGLILGVDCECATAAVVGARLGLSIGALFFCTDNVTLSDDGDRRYAGLGDPRVREAFEAGLEAVLASLAGDPGE